MEDIYSEIVKSLLKREKVALATVIRRVGSAPRAVGAKFLVREDGSSFGSISGGAVEAEVLQEAQGVMERGVGDVLHFTLTAEQLAAGGLICGGNIDILVESLKEEFLDIYQEALRLKQKGGSALLATLISVDGHFPKSGGSKVLLRPTGEKIGSLWDGEGLEQKVLKEGGALIRENKPSVLMFSAERADSPWRSVEILVEPIHSQPTVYIFGAGHISQQLTPLAKKVQFKVVVIDDRETFANRERFPEADEVIVSEFEKCFDRLPIDESSYLVIVTRGHLSDGFVLEQAIQTNACYIGMIGSKRKIEALYQNVLEKGIEKEALEKIHAPIGIDINSETPEEIAVSIVAELIQVRGQK
jgi:xanthine dehydrogenase accessory factor